MEYNKNFAESSKSELIDATNNVEDLMEFHPELLTALDESDQEILAKFFFAGRDIDVESVESYQADLEKTAPGITESAIGAYNRFMKLAGT